uniref:Orf73 n=1 Tax=Ancoracysta twista TaxID=2044563 RepID=A0A2H4R8G4_9EUKA|nr:orf73 [Ancoracysta twista]ATY40936.1 orf73 [Ancoracysta twista]
MIIFYYNSFVFYLTLFGCLLQLFKFYLFKVIVPAPICHLATEGLNSILILLKYKGFPRNFLTIIISNAIRNST